MRVRSGFPFEFAGKGRVFVVFEKLVFAELKLFAGLARDKREFAPAVGPELFSL